MESLETPKKTVGFRYSLQPILDAPSFLKNRIMIPRRVSDLCMPKAFKLVTMVSCGGKTASHILDGKTVCRTTAPSLHWRQSSFLFLTSKWPLLRKVYDTAIICLLECFMTIVSNTGSSIAPFVAQDLEIKEATAIVCLTTIYLIGQGIGGLIFPHIAESFGGRTIYLTSSLIFAVLCLAMAVWPSLPLLTTARFLTGMLSAMPCVVAAGSIENMWDIRSRIFAVHIWIAGAVLGLTLGPPFEIFISTNSEFGWPWVFTIAGAIMLGLTMLCFGMQESRPSQVLRQHVKIVSKEEDFNGLIVDDSDALPSLKTFVESCLTRPCRLFFTEPIVALTSIMCATVVAVVYLFSEGLMIIYRDGFGFDSRSSSLVMLAMAVGIIFSFLPRIYDIRVVSRRQSEGREVQPENKLFGFYCAAPILAASLWCFAATMPPLAQNIMPWVSIASLVFLGFSVVEFDTVLSGYLTDAYATYAASANAPMAFTRAILSGIFPLFGKKLFIDLGPNYALFTLAGCATIYCGIATVFGLYGKRIRERSPIAERTWARGADPEKLAIDEVEIARLNDAHLRKHKEWL